jgi:hypothetical protein
MRGGRAPARARPPARSPKTGAGKGADPRTLDFAHPADDVATVCAPAGSWRRGRPGEQLDVATHQTLEKD